MQHIKANFLEDYQMVMGLCILKMGHILMVHLWMDKLKEMEFMYIEMDRFIKVDFIIQFIKVLAF